MLSVKPADRRKRVLCGLTFELRRHRQRGTLGGKRKMGRRPSAWRPVCHAVGARLERGVRLQRVWQGSRQNLHAQHCGSGPSPLQEKSRYTASAARTSDLAWRSAICIALGNSFNIAFLFSDRRYGVLWRDRAPSERLGWLCSFSTPLWFATAGTVFALLSIRLWVMWSPSCRGECLCLAAQLTPPSEHSAEELHGSVSEA